MTQQGQIGGFWSYVHSDDEYENGRIARLRDRLERGIRFFSGDREFRIFLDRKDIGWGQKWKAVLTNSVNDALLLFPVITPSYFTSDACHKEALAFRDRQAALSREDLILPIYYLTASQIESSGQGAAGGDEVAMLLGAHQFEDWRALRETPEADPAYAKAVERLAQRAVEALNRASPPLPKPTAPARTAARSSGHAPVSEESVQVMETVGDAEAKEPGLIITFKVNPMPGRAQFTTISEAIARAPGGARILVEPGHYRESLIIDKPLELIGDGAYEDIIVEVDDNTVCLFDTNIGMIRNFTFRQSSTQAQYFCLLVKQGRLELEHCDLSSTSLSCIAVVNNADPRIRKSRIHHGEQSGLFVFDNGRGTYEENEFFGNLRAGISVKSGANPVVRRNRIFDGRTGGVLVFEDGRGTFEDNEIFGNAFAGIEVREGGDPIVRRNRIYDGHKCAILVSSDGRGVFEDNEIFGNAYAGIEVGANSDPIVRHNRIHDGKDSGVYIYDEGRGTFEGNKIDRNRRFGIRVESGKPIVRGNTFLGNEVAGVRIMKDGAGLFEDNELSDNGKPWDIDPLAKARVELNGNREA